MCFPNGQTKMKRRGCRTIIYLKSEVGYLIFYRNHDFYDGNALLQMVYFPNQKIVCRIVGFLIESVNIDTNREGGCFLGKPSGMRG